MGRISVHSANILLSPFVKHHACGARKVLNKTVHGALTLVGRANQNWPTDAHNYKYFKSHEGMGKCGVFVDEGILGRGP